MCCLELMQEKFKLCLEVSHVFTLFNVLLIVVNLCQQVTPVS